MEAALVKLPGVSGDEARRVSRSRPLTFNAAYTAAVLRIADDLYGYSFQDGRAVRLTNAPGAEELVSFSPDSKLVAFVRGNNLYVSEVATGRETPLTSDGAAKILNGRLDWVYEEEIYGRGENRAYWWSPDSTRLAFLRIDDTPVPTYTVVDHIPYEQNVEQWDYPKAGDPNPIVKLGIARVAGGPASWIDTAKYPPADLLLVRVGWTPDGRKVVYAAQNRTQTLARPEPGRSRIRRHPDHPSRNQQVLDQRRRRDAAVVAEGRIVPLAERSIGMAAPVSLPGPTAR